LPPSRVSFPHGVRRERIQSSRFGPISLAYAKTQTSKRRLRRGRCRFLTQHEDGE
jgi:hypothetical protein